MIKRGLETILIAIIFGFIFFLIHIPLPWMLGPITGIIIWNSVFKREVFIHNGFRNTGLIVLGYLIGSSFTLETGGDIIKQLPFMVFSTSLIVGFSLYNGLLFAKLTGVDISTGIIGSIPGGLSQMTVLGEEIKDANITVITFMQTIRILTVVFVVPFLAVHNFSHDDSPQSSMISDVQSGSQVPWHTAIFIIAILVSPILAKKIKLPTAFLIGPVFATVILTLFGLQSFDLPEIWIIVAQIVLGTSLGASMELTHLQNWKKILTFSVVSISITLLISFAISLLLSQWLKLSLLTIFLGVAPGGMTEMSITAALTGGNVPIVSAYQLFRILFILLVVPPLIKWLLTRKNKNDPIVKGHHH